jgi:uncharacterized membrane protein YgcG
MAPMELGSRRGSKDLDRYLLDGEKLVAAVHQHWAKVSGQIAAALGAFLLALFLDFNLPRDAQALSTFAWWFFFAVLLWAAYHVINWQRDWFVATDKRLLLFHGLITRKVSMMPLIKVTDMQYTRTIPGRLAGYGRFIMESAGQDQALSQVNFVPKPDHHYRAICAEIFGVDDSERVMEYVDLPYAGEPGPGGSGASGGGDMGPGGGGAGGPGGAGGSGRGPGGPGGSGPAGPAGPGAGGTHPPGSSSSGYSTAIPIHRPAMPEEQTERPEDEAGRIHDYSYTDSIYRSADLERDERRKARRGQVPVDREADTGPIPIYPREEWSG